MFGTTEALAVPIGVIPPSVNSGVALPLVGCSAIVIGASQGIGETIAVGLAEAGAAVVVAARRRERLRAALARVDERGEVLGAEEVDVGSIVSIRTFADRCLDRYGAPTIIVNSAGVSFPHSALDTSVEQWDAIQHVNVRGPFFTCQAFAPAMADVGYGKIVNISSIWAVKAVVRRAAYAASKASLSHLTAALALEWAPLGIRVNALAPAATRTPGVIERLAQDPGRETYLRDSIPLGRIAEPDDLIGAAVFLASRASDFVTGHTLLVDGGSRAGVPPIEFD